MGIQHTNPTYNAACAVAENSRQAAIAAAKAAGGGGAAIQAAVKSGEITYYQGLIAAAKTNNQPYAQFLQALTWLGGAV